MRAVKGDIIYSKNRNEVISNDDSYIMYEDGKVYDIVKELPERYRDIEIDDYTGSIIIPGFSDIHTHAPQYAFRGLNMDMELIEWLDNHVFVEEAKYSDIEYAKKAYEIFADDLKKSATTRFCIFATIHNEATLMLMDMLEKRGLKGYVGKVSMDRNSPEALCEKDGVKCVDKWIKEAQEKFKNVKPILTPRFIPSCSDDMMMGLGEIDKSTNLPVQSHLSENIGEIEWVKDLVPESKFYGDAYYRFGMFGQNGKTIMAHCVHSSDDEIKLMKNMGVFVAHSPSSNANLVSGVAPIKRYLMEGMHVGLGTDVAAGDSLSMFRLMAEAIKDSKLRSRLKDSTLPPLTFEEVFYMATKGGGEFFGKVGSFEKGYDMDAVIIDDSSLKCPYSLTVRERLERFVYIGEDSSVKGKYIAGHKINI